MDDSENLIQNLICIQMANKRNPTSIISDLIGSILMVCACTSTPRRLLNITVEYLMEIEESGQIEEAQYQLKALAFEGADDEDD